MKAAGYRWFACALLLFAIICWMWATSPAPCSVPDAHGQVTCQGDGR